MGFWIQIRKKLEVTSDGENRKQKKRITPHEMDGSTSRERGIGGMGGVSTWYDVESGCCPSSRPPA